MPLSFWMSLKGLIPDLAFPSPQGREKNGPPSSNAPYFNSGLNKGFIQKTFNGFTNISQKQYCLWTLEGLLEFVCNN